MYTPLVSVNMVSVRFFLVVGRFLKICNSFFCHENVIAILLHWKFVTSTYAKCMETNVM